MAAKSLKLQNSTITYQDQGEGTVVILLHGFCGSSSYWENIIPKLAETHRVIAPDLPGHGGSSILEGDSSIEGIADYLKTILDELKIHKAAMFGHSLGGYITLAFAEKYSDCLDGFSLVHSTAFPDSDEAKKGRDANIEKIKQSGIHAFVDGLVPKLFSPDNLDQVYVAAAKKIGYSTTPEGAMRTLEAMKNRPDFKSVLQATALPVLLIAGEKDQIIPSEKTFSVSKDNVKHVLIKDAGHMSMYENPDKLIFEMKDFLSSIQ